MHALITRWRNVMRRLTSPTQKQVVRPSFMAFPHTHTGLPTKSSKKPVPLIFG
jgi:hypothetical protein